MSLQRKLKAWEQAGLMDGATAQRILAYEAERSRPYALYVIGGLGALAVALGAISVVAANWGDIPRGVKMVLDLAVVGGLGWGVFKADESGKAWTREVLLLIFFGLVLASIGLIGQTYHLGGQPWQALLAWSLMTLPAMVIFGISDVSALALVIALNASVVATLGEWLDKANLDEAWEAFCITLLVGAPPFIHLLLSRIPALVRLKPNVARVCGHLGWMAVVSGSVAAQHVWYSRHGPGDDEYSGLMMAMPVVLALAAWVWWDANQKMAHLETRLRTSWSVVFIYSVVAAALPLVVRHDHAIGLVSALSVMGYCGVLAWFAYLHSKVWLFNLATALLALRLLVIFIELFGSLMDTGLGLIAGGILTLVLVRVWVKKTKQFRQEMRNAGGTP